MRAVSSPDRPLTVIPLQQVESLLSPAAPGHVREQTDRLVPPLLVTRTPPFSLMAPSPGCAWAVCSTGFNAPVTSGIEAPVRSAQVRLMDGGR